MDKLIEMKKDLILPLLVRGLIDKLTCEEVKKVADEQLSVIHQNVHLVAKVCPDCSDDQYEFDKPTTRNCETCKGHGVVARED